MMKATQEQMACGAIGFILIFLVWESEQNLFGLACGLFPLFKRAFRLFQRRRLAGVRLGPVFLSDNDRVRHCHIVGSPGSGKTEITKTLIFEDIRRGRGCFIIDAKGDRELFEEVRGFCRTVGRAKDLKLLSATYPDESSVWNPCGLGSASELQSKFLNANIYSEPYYAKACEVGLIQAFNELVKRKRCSALLSLILCVS